MKQRGEFCIVVVLLLIYNFAAAAIRSLRASQNSGAWGVESNAAHFGYGPQKEFLILILIFEQSHWLQIRAQNA